MKPSIIYVYVVASSSPTSILSIDSWCIKIEYEILSVIVVKAI